MKIIRAKGTVKITCETNSFESPDLRQWHSQEIGHHINCIQFNHDGFVYIEYEEYEEEIKEIRKSRAYTGKRLVQI